MSEGGRQVSRECAIWQDREVASPGCVEFKRALVMAAFQFCSAVQAISAPTGRGSPSPSGHRPRCTTHVKDPSGLVPLVNKVGWLRQESAKTTDPHVLVTWVKKVGGHAQAGESHSPSGRAGRGLDEHSVSVVAFQPRSPAGQAGRGLTRLV